jgi:hypothetical protein
MDVRPPYEKAAEETAKAVQRVAEVAGKSVDTTNALGGFLKTVLGTGLAEVGGAFGDWAAVYRYKQALRLADKVERIHKERGLEGKTIALPMRLGIPLLQKATLEDDEGLLDMWAGLIANATDPGTMYEARRTFCFLLSSFEPIDAVVLSEILRWKNLCPNRRGLSIDLTSEVEARKPWPNLPKISTSLNLPENSVALSLENLERLRLIYDFMPNSPHEIENLDGSITLLPQISGTPVPITHDHAMIDLTHTGVALMLACSRVQ